MGALSDVGSAMATLFQSQPNPAPYSSDSTRAPGLIQKERSLQFVSDSTCFPGLIQKKRSLKFVSDSTCFPGLFQKETTLQFVSDVTFFPGVSGFRVTTISFLSDRIYLHFLRLSGN